MMYMYNRMLMCCDSLDNENKKMLAIVFLVVCFKAVVIFVISCYMLIVLYWFGIL